MRYASLNDITYINRFDMTQVVTVVLTQYAYNVNISRRWDLFWMETGILVENDRPVACQW